MPGFRGDLGPTLPMDPAQKSTNLMLKLMAAQASFSHGSGAHHSDGSCTAIYKLDAEADGSTGLLFAWIWCPPFRCIILHGNLQT